jgi:hypothetical protein
MNSFEIEIAEEGGIHRVAPMWLGEYMAMRMVWPDEKL